MTPPQPTVGGSPSSTLEPETESTPELEILEATEEVVQQLGDEEELIDPRLVDSAELTVGADAEDSVAEDDEDNEDEDDEDDEVEMTIVLPLPTQASRASADIRPSLTVQEAPASEAEREPVKLTGPKRAQFDQPEEAPAADDVPRETVEPMARPANTRIMVIANQKGGVGKTTTAVNLAAALGLGGLRVLVIDLDPQGNASTALGVAHDTSTPGTYDVLINGDSIAEHVQPSPEGPYLTVLPSSIDLAAAEIELVSIPARESRLREAVNEYVADHDIDYVIFDCPPSLGLLTLNALVAAKEILIPIQCEYYALEGVSQLMNTINLVKGALNDGLELSTVLLTMFDPRTRLAAQVVDEVRTHFTDQTLSTVIPRSVRISEAPSYGQTVLSYDPQSTGSVCYLRAAREIADRGAKESR